MTTNKKVQRAPQNSETQTIMLNGHCQIHHEDLKSIDATLVSLCKILQCMDSKLDELCKLFKTFPKSIKAETSPRNEMFEMMLAKIIDAEKEKYFDD